MCRKLKIHKESQRDILVKVLREKLQGVTHVIFHRVHRNAKLAGNLCMLHAHEPAHLKHAATLGGQCCNGLIHTLLKLAVYHLRQRVVVEGSGTAPSSARRDEAIS